MKNSRWKFLEPRWKSHIPCLGQYNGAQTVQTLKTMSSLKRIMTVLLSIWLVQRIIRTSTCTWRPEVSEKALGLWESTWTRGKAYIFHWHDKRDEAWFSVLWGWVNAVLQAFCKEMPCSGHAKQRGVVKVLHTAVPETVCRLKWRGDIMVWAFLLPFCLLFTPHSKPFSFPLALTDK